MFFLKVVNKISNCRKNSCIERELCRNYDDIVKRRQSKIQRLIEEPYRGVSRKSKFQSTCLRLELTFAKMMAEVTSPNIPAEY